MKDFKQCNTYMHVVCSFLCLKTIYFRKRSLIWCMVYVLDISNWRKIIKGKKTPYFRPRRSSTLQNNINTPTYGHLSLTTSHLSWFLASCKAMRAKMLNSVWKPYGLQILHSISKPAHPDQQFVNTKDAWQHQRTWQNVFYYFHCLASNDSCSSHTSVTPRVGLTKKRENLSFVKNMPFHSQVPLQL